ncbi:MAG: DNA-3-methyladenine glycosylase I [Candidatus Omnitrophica bacterium]|nr:DNA-3-methyladenine glycosylase I [Candidatus Omnitrophota bacterium]
MRAVRQRCEWGDWSRQPEIMMSYHDTEWGVPLHEDRKLFEFLILEGMQAGLSWVTVLKKREAFRAAFDQFDPTKIARYGRPKIQALLRDAGIIRNRLKIEGAIANARAFLEVQEAQGSFSRLMWQFVDGKPIVNRWRRIKDLPVTTKASEAMSKKLKRLGFRFVGSTICYAHMQATGMVNDHVISCFRHSEIARGGFI